MNTNNIRMGALNLTPIKISGQYKIVVNNHNKLFLDDYTGRRVIINKNESFLYQVSKFLFNKNDIVDKSKLRYGGYSLSNSKKYWHIPLYLGDSLNDNNKKLPDYFCVDLLPNLPINKNNEEQILSESKLVYKVDLKECGLHKILSELYSKDYDYPLYTQFENNLIKLYGYSIKYGTPVVDYFDMEYYMINQPYLDVLNNSILNTYERLGLIYPRFINIEFEFDTIINIKPISVVQNYYGYFGFEEKITKLNSEKIIDRFFIDTKEYKIDNQSHKKILETNLNSFKYTISNIISVINVSNKPRKYRIFYNRINVDDYVIIKNKLDKIVFEIKIKPNLFNNLSSYITIDRHIFEFKKTQNKKYYGHTTINNKYLIQHNKRQNYFDIITEDEYNIEISSNFQYELYNGIYTNKHKLIRNVFGDIENIKDVYLHINNQFIKSNIIKYGNEIGEYDYYLETLNIRDEKINLYKKHFNNVYIINKIPMLLFDSSIEGKYLFDFSEIDKNRFNPFKLINFDIHENKSHSIYLGDKNKLDINTDDNKDSVKNIMFKSSGQSQFNIPNILNIDKRFWSNKIKYDWFLIYLGDSDDIIEYSKSITDKRYYSGNSQKPTITSKLIELNSLYCETVFLGINYLLPIEFVGFEFYVYLRYDVDNYKLDKKFHIDYENRTIGLELNKNILLNNIFIDKNGNSNLKQYPLDLGLLYNLYDKEIILPNINMEEPLCLEFVDEIKTTENIRFKFKQVNSIINFEQFFNTNNQTTQSYKFYLESKLKIDGIEYSFISMEFTLVDVYVINKNEIIINDMEVILFPNILNNKYFIYDSVENKIIEIDYNKLPTNSNDIELIFENRKIINPFKKHKLSENWYQYNVDTENIYNNKGVKSIIESISGTNNTLSKNYGKHNLYGDYNENLFNVDGLWKIIIESLYNGVGLKTIKAKQISDYYNDLNINSYDTERKINIPVNNDKISIPLIIKKPEIVNVIWDKKISVIERQNSMYFPHFEVVKSLWEFQNNIYKTNENIHTTLNELNPNNWWLPVNNVISSLFELDSDLYIKLNFENETEFDLINSIINSNIIQIGLDKIVLIGMNLNNLSEYEIKYKFVKMLLINFYMVDSVIYKNKRIEFQYKSNKIKIKKPTIINNNMDCIVILKRI